MIDYSQYNDGTSANWYVSDLTMQHYFHRYVAHLAEWGEKQLVDWGAYCAGPMEKRAQHTDREGAPRLIRYNRQGEEINEVWYNEGYLTTRGDCYESGVVGLRYSEETPMTVPFFYTQLLFMLMSEAEVGFTCPVTLTMSVAFVLEKYGSEEQKKKYLPRLASMKREELEEGATFLTEIQGGSDVGATQTVAVKNGDHYLLTGEKWFASNCDAGLSITLARVGDTPGTRGLSLFLMPRVLPNGEKNKISIRRLKDKLGVRAVASGELILNQAVGYLIGKEDDGFKIMAEALNVSRMCTTMGSLAISRRAFLESVIYTSRREAFGDRLTQYPMVCETLLNMMTEIEAVWALSAQMMRVFDRVHTYNEGTQGDQALLRYLLALSKYRSSENGTKHAKEALELHGGNGYIEEYVTPRLLRDAQVNTVWEGASNIMALELVKLFVREAKGNTANTFILFDTLQRTLEGVTLPVMIEAVDILTKKLEKVKEDVLFIMGAKPNVQNAQARCLLDQVVHLTCAIFLVEEAHYAKKKQGTDRLWRIAEYYVNRTYRPEMYGIQSEDIPAIDLFHVAVCYAEEMHSCH